MAARSHKILREIFFKHYRYNSKIVSPIYSNVTRNCSQNITKKKVPSSKLTHTQLGQDLANNYLQPALLPAFSTHHRTFDVAWPKTESVTKTSHPAKIAVSNDVVPKSKISSFFYNNLLNIQNRHYSTLFSSTRRYSNNKKWGNQTEPEECPPPKRECYKPCPKWQMQNCPPQGNNLDCTKAYTDPCCKKKMAPYPSYSELCAERLEDDPSECMQCPWSRCGGTDSLKYPKRKYHTGTLASLRGLPTTVIPIINIDQFTIKCDAKKPPCKRPPGKCDKVQKPPPCPEAKKGPCPPPFERKKCDKEKQASSRWMNVYRIWNEKNTVLPMNEDWTDSIPIEEQSFPVAIRAKKDDDCQGDMITPDNSCCLKLPFDKKQMDYEKIRHKQCHKPNCKRKKRKMVPDDCDGWCNKKCADSNLRNLFDVCYECQKKKKRCPRDDCHRPKCPERNLYIDKRYKPADPCCKKALKETLKGRKVKPKVFVPDSPDHD